MAYADYVHCAGCDKKLVYDPDFDADNKKVWCEACVGTLSNRVAKLEKALGTISRSAPCKDGHESFNSPGQPCDQRIAEEALAPRQGNEEKNEEK